jgi:hypothetical protein
MLSFTFATPSGSSSVSRRNLEHDRVPLRQGVGRAVREARATRLHFQAKALLHQGSFCKKRIGQEGHQFVYTAHVCMPKDEKKEFEKDILVLQAFRQGRSNFSTRIVEASLDQSPAVLSLLRTDAMYQLAEFFFLLKGFGIGSEDELCGLLDRHNRYVSQLLNEPDKMQRMGLTKERLLAAIFDGETRPRVLRSWADEPGTLDQSSIGRLLVAVMSEETARKTLVACGSAGFLDRRNSVFRLVLVKSTGVMEAVYGACLRTIRVQISQDL